MKRWPEEEAGISLNSLLDVLFILLLFLMISLNLKPENYLDLRLPEVNTRDEEAGNDPALLVELSSNQEVFLKYGESSERFPLADLTAHRKQLLDLCTEKRRVLLRVDRAVIYEDFVQVLETLKACDGADLAVQKSD
ncbi:biopolymer transporter ExbD [Leptonema illini]|jgi:biopolymer transport protein ExbD|uniref:Biopolymer transport protein ExbD/TolR n=1 Tax=Leptonema illini DSM 21528 TaxID=929563 RepID=H2CFC9_9LEPT|nr:biopolymer transporter ExbD [Leptonema illini]EHQ06757.1 Biopolymer transport protein ExbD/TolR [Leptonema illini DSM 21528]